MQVFNFYPDAYKRLYQPLATNGYESLKGRFSKLAQWIGRVALWGTASVAWAAPGDLDATFGLEGSTITYDEQTQGSYSVSGNAIATDNNGNVFVAGDGHYILKYDSAGDLDTSFGDMGAAFVLGELDAIQVLDSGKVVFSGYFGSGGLIVGQLNADGNPDTSFSGDGYGRVDLGYDSMRVNDIAIQSDGKIVLAATSRISANYYGIVARFNSDGSVDNDFGTDGALAVNLGSYTGLTSVALTADEQIVAAGYSIVDGSDLDGLLVRLTSAGVLDTDFGAGASGITTLDVVSDINDRFNDLVLQADGRIVVVGNTDNDGEVLLVGYTSTGMLDTDFGTGGYTITDIQGASDIAVSIAMDSDSRLWVAGFSNNSQIDPMILAYTNEGVLDTSISDDGMAVFDWSDNTSFVYDMVLDDAGNLLLAGSVNEGAISELRVARYTSALAVDSSFGSDGQVISQLSAESDSQINALLVMDDDSVIAVGEANSENRFLLMKLNADGSVDTNFGDSGRVLSSGPELTAVARQSDGHVIASGRLGFDEYLSLIRFDASGNLDTLFGTDGVLTTDIYDWYTYSPLAVQSDDAIVVGGTRVSTDLGYEIMTLRRFDASGNLDSSFGDQGVVELDAGAGGYSAITHIIANEDGTLLITGDVYDAEGNGVLFVARYTADGQPDTSFGNNGQFQFALDGYNLFSVALERQADGSLIVAGPAYSGSNGKSLLVARLTADGELDTGFGSSGYTLVSLANYTELILETLSVLANDAIVVGGYAKDGAGEQPLLVRFDANGSLDTGFGNDGFARPVVSVGENRGIALAVQSSGKILLGGYASVGGSQMPLVSRYLSGPATLELSDTSLTFANTQTTQTSAATQLVLTNTGSAALTIDAISISGDFNVSGDCININPGSSCALEITFAPTTEGALTGSLTIVSELGSDSVSLAGTGLPLDSDNDGTPDADDAFPGDPNETADFDNDGIGNNADTDDDNDQMSDSFELLWGLDPFDASDAALDTDSDGLTNVEEYFAGLNPTVDDVAPVLMVPADIEVESTGATTSVDLGVASAEDALDGTVTPSADNTGPFAPGRHVITWTATDSKGNTATDTQRVDVIPQLSVAASQTVTEGSAVHVVFTLNGAAVSYPVTVDYTLGGTATSDDHTAVAGTLSIASGFSSTLTFTALDDAIYEGTESLLINLSNPTNAVLGSVTQHTLLIAEENVAPQVAISLMQDGITQAVAYADAGTVTLQATVTDPNVGEQHSFQWQSDSLISLNPNGIDTFQFEPVAGSYEISVTVTDMAGASSTRAMTVRVESSLPALSADVDSDGDGISDADEGVTDADGDRIPDYLDPPTAANLVPADSDGNFMQAPVGTQLVLGNVSYGAGLNSARMTLQQLMDYFGDEFIANPDVQLLHGVFDFEVQGVEVGVSAQVVLPLPHALLANAAYQKYVPGTGWVALVEDANNGIASAPGVDGVCPAPGDASYQPGLTEGDACVQLTLADGGANDADGEANGVIVDPGAIVTGAVAAPMLSAANNGISVSSFKANDGEKVVLDFVITSDSSDAVLETLTLQASGSMNDATAVSAVNLYLDSNQNGVAEADERIGEGSYSADNGSLLFTLASPYQLPVGESRLLVTYTF